MSADGGRGFRIVLAAQLALGLALTVTTGLAVLAGCLGPAVRALRVDPAVTLREL